MPQKKRKSYSQPCTIARALDIVGDRWTLLILRELLGGPARFHELQQGLPGIPKNLLSERLKQLQGDALVERMSLHGATFYALTPLGLGLRKTVEELGIWGMRFTPKDAPLHYRSIRTMAMTLHAILTRGSERLPKERFQAELKIGTEYLDIVLGPKPNAIARRSTAPDIVLEISAKDFNTFLAGEAVSTETFSLISGEEKLKHAALKAFGITTE